MDLLLTRYSDIEYVMTLSIIDGIELIEKAYDKRTDEQLMQRWILHYEKEMSFDEFKNTLMNGFNSSKKTDEEILEDVKDIINTFNKGVI